MKTLAMKFAELPFKKQKTIFITLEISLGIGMLAVVFLMPKDSVWYNLKYMMLIGIFVIERNKRIFRNKENGLPESNINAKNRRISDIILIAVLAIMVFSSFFVYYSK